MIIVLQESSTGRNLVFQDTKTRKKMTRAKFVKEIEQGNYDDFHVRLNNGVKTPCSNPDGKVKNNLG